MSILIHRALLALAMASVWVGGSAGRAAGAVFAGFAKNLAKNVSDRARR